MSSTPEPPQAPRLSATQPPQRVPTQILDAVDSVRTEVQRVVEPPDGAKKEPWNNKLFECCSPGPGLCCYACFCPCLVYGRIWHRLKASSPAEEVTSCNIGCLAFYYSGYFAAPIPLILLGRKIKQVRKRYNIKGSFEEDILKALCCTVCALVQAEKEIKEREKGGEGQYGEGREMMQM